MNILGWIRCASRRTALIAGLATLLAACGGGGGAGGAADPPPSARLGAAGGTVADAGARAEIPAGALASTTDVAIAPSSAGAPPVPPGITALGPMFEMTPHGTAFAVPVTLRIPFDRSLLPAGAVPVLLKTDPTRSGWLPVTDMQVDGQTLVGRIGEFSNAFAAAALAPVITLPPASATAAPGGNVTFSVGVIGTPVLTYQWRRDGVDLVGATGPSYTALNVQGSDDGARFGVVIRNASGQATSGDAVLHVQTAATPPAIVNPPLSISVVAGQDATFSVSAGGSPPLGYQWRIGGAAQAGATGTTFTMAAVTLAQSGSVIDVVVSNAAGSITSAGAVLTVTAVTPPPSIGATRLAVSGFALAALANGTGRSWGDGAYVGDPGAGMTRTSPGPIVGVSGIVGVAAGSLHGLAVTSAGDVWGWGYDGFGALGDGQGGPGVSVATPKKISTISGVAAVAAGQDFSVFLKSDGTVWTAGDNGVGQLGSGNLSGSSTVVQVPISNVAAVSTSGYHVLALKVDGTVWAWGLNLNCQIGNTSGNAPCVNQRVPVQVPGLRNVIGIAAGADHSLAVVAASAGDRFGAVWGWGSNARGQLGIGVATPQIKVPREVWNTPAAQVVAGERHSLVIHFDGTVFSFGDNLRRQLGDATFTAAFSDQPVWVSAISGSAIAAAASNTTLVQMQDGSVWSWGENTYGQCGNGTSGSVPVAGPVRVTGLNLN